MTTWTGILATFIMMLVSLSFTASMMIHIK